MRVGGLFESVALFLLSLHRRPGSLRGLQVPFQATVCRSSPALRQIRKTSTVTKKRRSTLRLLRRMSETLSSCRQHQRQEKASPHHKGHYACGIEPQQRKTTWHVTQTEHSSSICTVEQKSPSSRCTTPLGLSEKRSALEEALTGMCLPMASLLAQLPREPNAPSIGTIP